MPRLLVRDAKLALGTPQLLPVCQRDHRFPLREQHDNILSCGRLGHTASGGSQARMLWTLLVQRELSHLL